MPHLHPPAVSLELLGLTDAAALLQPHLGRLNAANWLTDLRRLHPVYQRRVYTSPNFVKHDRVIKYPKSEIQRLIEELKHFARRPLTGSSAPVTPAISLP